MRDWFGGSEANRSQDKQRTTTPAGRSGGSWQKPVLDARKRELSDSGRSLLVFLGFIRFILNAGKEVSRVVVLSPFVERVGEGRNVGFMVHPAYIVGLTDGEGCFHVQIRQDFRVVLRYFITQTADNRVVLDKVHDFFQCGYVYRKGQYHGRKKDAYVFEVTKQDDIRNRIIPFFKEFPLEGIENFSFLDFARIAEISCGRQDTRKLSERELGEVVELKRRMNFHPMARPVREIRSPGGNAKQPKLSQSVK